MIKFLNLYDQDKNLHKSIIFKIKKLLKKGDFILGDETQIFEKNLVNFVNLSMLLVVLTAQML